MKDSPRLVILVVLLTVAGTLAGTLGGVWLGRYLERDNDALKWRREHALYMLTSMPSNVQARSNTIISFRRRRSANSSDGPAD